MLGTLSPFTIVPSIIMLIAIMLTAIMLSVANLHAKCCYTGSLYAECLYWVSTVMSNCRYVECHCAECLDTQWSVCWTISSCTIEFVIKITKIYSWYFLIWYKTVYKYTRPNTDEFYNKRKSQFEKLVCIHKLYFLRSLRMGRISLDVTLH
jgi:hypothetical protein